MGRKGRGGGALVTAWNSSLRPGEQRQGTAEAGQQESLGSHWSGRRRTVPGPRTFCFRAWAGRGSWAAQRIPPGCPGSGRGGAGGSRPGRSCAAALSAGCSPRPCPWPPPRMGGSQSPRRARPPSSPPAPGSLCPAPHPCAACCKAAAAAPASGKRNLTCR